MGRPLAEGVRCLLAVGKLAHVSPKIRPPLDAAMSRARLPQCGAPDLTTFKAATSSDEQRAMHAEPEVCREGLRA